MHDEHDRTPADELAHRADQERKRARERYQGEVRRLRGELTGLRGGGGDEPERPKRLSLSQILELLLTRGGAGERSHVTLSRNASGETQIEVKVRTGDDGDVSTIEAAEQRALEVYGRLVAQYPAASEHDAASVSLTRNAKGETQIEVKATTNTERPTVDALAEHVVKVYDQTRGKYPMLDGRTAKPGSVA